jgi:hypothetical protein
VAAGVEADLVPGRGYPLRVGAGRGIAPGRLRRRVLRVDLGQLPHEAVALPLGQRLDRGAGLRQAHPDAHRVGRRVHVHVEHPLELLRPAVVAAEEEGRRHPMALEQR